jgi:serine/threonine protein kinase/tetratricopeptide (TPR) repeat protein
VQVIPNEARGALSGRIFGQFQIKELIGRGGMGDVYRALDSRLGRTVAIKAMNPRLVDSPKARLRFLNETRIASKIVHPFVATVFDVVDSDDNLLLVMEYLEGRTLNKTLKEKKTEPDQLLTWSVEITEALSAIHSAGLIHRDLKPSNIMITPAGHAKVMDFGLARQVRSSEIIDSREDTETNDERVTSEGDVFGTPLYMSPEQLRGRDVDDRSDLFSLGIILYETFSGVHPFKRESLADSTAAILTASPETGGEPGHFEGTPSLHHVLLKLLDKNPTQRHQSAAELLQDLQSLATESKVKQSGRPLMTLAAVMLPLVLLAAGITYWLRLPPNWDKPRISIAVVPFEDHTGDPDGIAEAALVGELLSIDLGASRLARVVGTQQITPLITRGSSQDEIASRTISTISLDYVLLGSLYKEGDEYLGTLRFRPRSADREALAPIRAHGNSPLALAEALASAARSALPEIPRLTVRRDDRVDLAEITSNSDEAQLIYERGRIALRERRLGEAISNFVKATTIDPTFALAHVSLAQAYDLEGNSREARESATRARSHASDDGSRAAERLRLLIESTWFRVYDRLEEAVAITADLVTRFPDEPSLLVAYAEALKKVDRHQESIDQFDRALDIDPDNPSIHLQRGEALVYAGWLDRAEESLTAAEHGFSLVESPEGQAAVNYARGRGLLYQDRYEESIELLKSSRDIYSRAGLEASAAEVTLYLAATYVNQGNPATAGELLDALKPIVEGFGNRKLLCQILTAQGAVQMANGAYVAAVPLLREAVDLARQLENNSLLSDPLTNLAFVMLQVGPQTEADRLLEEALSLARAMGLDYIVNAGASILGQRQYDLGELDKAIETYTSALETEERQGVTRETNQVRYFLAITYERQDRLAEALETIDLTIENFRTLSIQGLLGHALVVRTRVLAALGREAAALEDAVEAERIATADDGGLEGLLMDCDVARGYIMAYRGDYRGALEQANRAVSRSDSISAGTNERPMLLTCLVWSQLGNLDKAEASCRAVIESGDTSLPVRVDAESILLNVLARNGSEQKAAELASEVAERAERMHLQLPFARAISMKLTTLPENKLDQAESLRGQGLDVLNGYVTGAPEGDRQSLEVRGDLVRLKSVFTNRR